MNDFNETTGVYTVPIAGRYLLFYGTQGKTSSNSNAGSIYYNINNTGISGQCLYYVMRINGNSQTVILNLAQMILLNSRFMETMVKVTLSMALILVSIF